MDEIELRPAPWGDWVMICQCGHTEIRSAGSQGWQNFEVKPLPGSRYDITCLICRRRTERECFYRDMGRIRPDPS
ncbi:hypothetical protein [Halomonas cerina]|uniref:Uncharacterized protein n=1 Tax=Halomonas cerina TaxID=447424 RepID=A0A839V5G3_9GAMM|nr:hypothetical protein [Halomonas cerina]MBB3190923.1 hypothetical protein [Halomonas cerina]